MLQTRPTYRKVTAEDYYTPSSSLCLDWSFRPDEFWILWRSSLILCNICKDSTLLSFPDSPISFSFTTAITALHHALGWCLQHHPTCPIISLDIFTNSPYSLSLPSSASNLLAQIAVWAVWSSIAAYLILPNCTSIGSLATAIYVPMRSQTY